MIGKRLKDLRTEKGLTQNELAVRLGVSQRTIAYYEKDEKNPEYDILLLMAEIFECSTDYLLNKVNKKDEYQYVVEKAKKSNISAERLDKLIEILKNDI